MQQLIIILMINSQSQLQDKINLIKWESRTEKKYFPLTTIHSLLIDNHPKFKHLKKMIENYNLQNNPDRINLQQGFIERLFKMMSEATRIHNSENQIQFLNGIYRWAMNGDDNNQKESDAKVRPTTASTKARTHSAISRPTTARYPSTNLQKITATVREDDILKMKKANPKVDYTRLKNGQKQFYAGVRSLHPELQHPKKRLKDYQRKVFYEEQDDSDLEVINIQPQEKVQTIEQKLIQQIEQAQPLEGEERQEGNFEGQDGENIEGVNIDDIPLEGEQAGEAVEEEQPQQVVDKLKPRIKAYGYPKDISQFSHKHYEEGNQIGQAMRNYHERKVQEDVEFAYLAGLWAQKKSRAKSQLKRRSESARIVTKHIGITNLKQQTPAKQWENVVNFQNIQPVQINKSSRPISAFVPTNAKNRQEIIKNAFICGKLSSHVNKFDPLSVPSQLNPIAPISSHAGPPKKKTFEQILKEAEQRVMNEAKAEVYGVKEAFAKNKISIGANKIAKSITYYQKQLDQQGFAGQITGLAMIKNPFIKIAKKKKKKKKK